MNNQYSFCKFRIPDNGRRVIWEITNECNYGCKYCIFASTGKKPEGELDTAQVFQVLQSLKDMGFTYIKYTGGEPFIREDMMEILRQTKALGFECDISTNASKITLLMAQELSELKLEMIHVSLDGHTQEVHEFVRGKKAFTPTINGLKKLLNAKNKIRIGCVIHEKNQDFIKEMIQYCEQLNVDELIFSMMEPVGRLKGKNIGLSNRALEEMKHDILTYSNKIKISHNFEPLLSPLKPLSKLNTTSCPGGDKFLFINSLGMVSPCPWVADKRPDLMTENIKEKPLPQIMQSMNRFQAVTKFLPGVCPVEDLSKFNSLDKFYGKIYSFTTENLSYMTSLSFKDKEVMTVGGSFDQAIVAYLLGAKKVINFDINPIAKYWAELKYNCMKEMNYDSFKSFFLRNNKSLNYQTFCTIKHLLKQETLNFFEQQYVLFPQIRESLLFNNKHDSFEKKLHLSYYLLTKDNYTLAQKSLKEFNWITQGISTIKNNNFDIILLSNISDYSHLMYKDNHLNQYRDNIVKPLFNQLRDKGVIMFGYIYDFNNSLNPIARNEFNLTEKRVDAYKNIGLYSEIIVDTALDESGAYDCACLLEKK